MTSDYKTKNRSSLNNQNTRESIICDCDQHGYESAGKEILKTHKQSKQEGISYRCDRCDYNSLLKQEVKIRKQSKHEGVIIECDLLNIYLIHQSKIDERCLSLCILKCIFNWFNSIKVKLQWLHLSDFSPLCLILLAWEKVPSLSMCFLKMCISKLLA